MDNDEKDVDCEELRNKTQELVEKMKLNQKGLSKCLEEILGAISSQDDIFEKAAILDKSHDARLVKGQTRDLLVRSYDLTQQGTAKKKLVALAKRQPKNTILRSPASGKPDEDTDPTARCSNISDQNESVNSVLQDSTHVRHDSNDMMNYSEVFESSGKSASDSAADDESLSDSEPETQKKITPNSVKRRRIIDKNIKVHSGEILDQIDQELDRGLGLNYSYSNIDSDSNSDSVAEAGYMSDLDVLDEPDCGKDVSKMSQRVLSNGNLSATGVSRNRKTTPNYEDILVDPGNIKPDKPILERTTHKKSKRQTRTALGNLYLNNRTPKSQEHKLLGYDWIASVLDNKGETSFEITDDHFEELRNFWKEQQERPITDLNLLKTYVDDSQEPQLIQDILAESKIQAFRINNRLFPELVRKKKHSGKEDDYDDHLGIENRQPAFGSPRYVSVTVPNNAITVNPATRSHRRGSVDSSETLSLGKHCIMGWESSCLNVPPTGTTLSMKDATTGSKTKQVLTLEEAEELAKGCRLRQISRFFTDKSNLNRQQKLDLLSGPKNPAAEVNKKKSQHKSSDFLKRVAEATNPPENDCSNSSVRSTSELLDSAYSLMRDLDRIKHEHNMKRLARTELGGIP